MKNINGQQDSSTVVADWESITKRQIFEKFLERMKEARNGNTPDSPLCAELNPDVIVISSDQSLFFEPQNRGASEVLRRRCGLGTENVEARERIRVHPCKSRKLIDDLKAAGLTVAY